MTTANLLLVDDNPIFLKILRRFLSQQTDLSVTGTAQSGSDALTKARLLKPDVILLDLTMRDTSGLEAIPRLRAELPHVRIIVVTLCDSTAYRNAALAGGADDFVSKVAMNVDLVPAIRNMFDRGPVAHPDQGGS